MQGAYILIIRISTGIQVNEERRNRLEETQEKNQLTENNRVIVRIWTSGMWGPFSGLDLPKGKDAGHATLQIPSLNVYVSLWPAREDGKAIKSGIKTLTTIRPPCFEDTPEADADNEGPDEVTPRLPEALLCFYSLDIERMQARFVEKKPQITGWKLAKLGFWGKSLENSTYNCSGIVTDILASGGIEPLLEKRIPSFRQNVTDPDDLLRKLKYAKRKELTLYPETNQFEFQHETPVPQLVGRKTGCTIS